MRTACGHSCPNETSANLNFAVLAELKCLLIKHVCKVGHCSLGAARDMWEPRTGYKI